MTIKTWVLSLMAVVVGWVTIQVSVMYFTDAAPGAVVLFATPDFVSALPSDIAIVGGGGKMAGDQI